MVYVNEQRIELGCQLRDLDIIGEHQFITRQVKFAEPVPVDWVGPRLGVVLQVPIRPYQNDQGIGQGVGAFFPRWSGTQP